jgi:hypothetical protein
MSVGKQDHGGVPMPISAGLPSDSHQSLDFGAGEIFAGARD